MRRKESRSGHGFSEYWVWQEVGGTWPEKNHLEKNSFFLLEGFKFSLVVAWVCKWGGDYKCNLKSKPNTNSVSCIINAFDFGKITCYCVEIVFFCWEKIQSLVLFSHLFLTDTDKS